MTHLVSVVIPTLGRASLAAAISSVLRQDVPVQIVVVNDAGQTIPNVLSKGVMVVHTPGRTGAAAARNAGFAAATGDYIALLDDDDEWLPGHLTAALSYLDRAGSQSVYCCRGLVIGEGGTGRIEPVDPLGDQDVRGYTFGASSLISTGRRILTPTLVFPRSLTDKATMEVGLRQSEDTWWLLSLEHHHGVRVHQSDRIGVVVQDAADRRASRQATSIHLDWADRVEQLGPGTGAAHLVNAARSAAKAGDRDDVLVLARGAWQRPGGRRWAPLFAAEAALATLVGWRGRR